MSSTFKVKLEKDKIISILGKRGVGKTELIKYFVKALSQYYPIYIFDQVHNFNDSKFIPLNEKQYKPELLYSNRVFVMKEQFPSDFSQFCADIMKLYQYNQGKRHCYVVFDEIYLKVTNFNLDSEENENFKKMLIIGRNYGIGLIFASQRPAIMSKTILSQSNQIYTFRLYLAQDLKAIEDYFNVNDVLNLQNYHFIGFFPDLEKERTIAFKPIPLGEKVKSTGTGTTTSQPSKYEEFLKDEKMASTEYTETAKKDKEHSAIFSEMANDERKHAKNIEKILKEGDKNGKTTNEQGKGKRDY